jgi:hypothetical protein
MEVARPPSRAWRRRPGARGKVGHQARHRRTHIAIVPLFGSRRRRDARQDPPRRRRRCLAGTARPGRSSRAPTANSANSAMLQRAASSEQPALRPSRQHSRTSATHHRRPPTNSRSQGRPGASSAASGASALHGLREGREGDPGSPGSARASRGHCGGEVARRSSSPGWPPGRPA